MVVSEDREQKFYRVPFPDALEGECPLFLYSFIIAFGRFFLSLLFLMDE